MKKRIGGSFRQSADFHGAARRKSCRESLAGLTGALVGVGNDADMLRVGTAARREKSL